MSGLSGIESGIEVFSVAPNAMVFINSVPAGFCTLSQYVGSYAIASATAEGGLRIVGRVDVLVPPPPPTLPIRNMALSESKFGSTREANLKAGAPEFALAKVRWPKVWATGGGFELPFKKLMIVSARHSLRRAPQPNPQW
jgi:hypothetical protein